MILVYLKSYKPSEEENRIIFDLENEGHEVRVRNAKFYRGEVEPCDAVVTSSREVFEAYNLRGYVVTYNEPPDVNRPKEHRIEHEIKKGGWVSITVDGEEVRKVRKGQLKEALEEIRGSLV